MEMIEFIIHLAEKQTIEGRRFDIEVRCQNKSARLTEEQAVELFGKNAVDLSTQLRAFFEEPTPPHIASTMPQTHDCPPVAYPQTAVNDCPLAIGPPTVTNDSPNEAKVELFLSLFRGRNDVYAQRWEGKDGQKSGYSPVCHNEWVRGICEKPRVKCANCKHCAYVPLDARVAASHLAGREVVGVYPMLQDESCLLLAMDFDGEGWRRDVFAIRAICERNGIPVAVERSRSGNGAHAWLFFAEPISAALARRLGSALLTIAMEEHHELNFTSYDRLFPNQDTLPKGGFGNLIALPLQREARTKGNSVFVDLHLEPYPDQWAFLSTLKPLTTTNVERHIASLCKTSDLGDLCRSDMDENTSVPWKRRAPTPNLRRSDFPSEVCIVEANMLYIAKDGLSHRALNLLKRLAAFKNPEFFKAQAMRLPTWNKPRVISISSETELYLCLPRGCKADVLQMLEALKVPLRWQDERNGGKDITASFNGTLRDEQSTALNALLAFDNGVLSATTAFGKTVVAAALIAMHKVNTLVLVNRQPLLDQWKARLTEFLCLERSAIGQLGGGKNDLGGILDIAILQSVVRGDEVKELVKDYGMVIVDECHHVSAVSFERVLREVNAKYVYGLTATPKRLDGHHPIIAMHCGPIRYQDDAKLQAQRRPFDHFVIPRFTAFRLPVEKDDSSLSIQELYSEVWQNDLRNDLIVADVLAAMADGRNPLILTERVSHVERLADALKNKVPNVLTFVGGQSAKERRALLENVEHTPTEQPLAIVATGKYLGEGFDVPRLDTLFLAMPIAWQGTLAQYVGRLHRQHDGKREVQVYDYADIHVAVLDRMYAKRVKGYASMGYKTKGDAGLPETGNTIFDGVNFLPVFTTDVLSARHTIVVVSPFLTRTRIAQMGPLLGKAMAAGAKITVVTRPVGEYTSENQARIVLAIELLRKNRLTVVERPRIHQKFAVLDGRVTWYGSINLLSFGTAEESVMRLESTKIAGDLLNTLK